MTRFHILLGSSIACFAAVGFALISQHGFGMQPCAWCVLQRIVLVMVGVVCLAGAMIPRAARIASAVGAVLSAAGSAAAWFQITVASSLASCDRTLADRLVASSGLDDLAPAVFGVYANCADAVVFVLGVEYAVWGLLAFVVLAAGLGFGAVGRMKGPEAPPAA